MNLMLDMQQHILYITLAVRLVFTYLTSRKVTNSLDFPSRIKLTGVPVCDTTSDTG